MKNGVVWPMVGKEKCLGRAAKTRFFRVSTKEKSQSNGFQPQQEGWAR